MEWVLMIFLWHGDGATSQQVPMRNSQTCEAAAIRIRQAFAEQQRLRPWLQVTTTCFRRDIYGE